MGQADAWEVPSQMRAQERRLWRQESRTVECSGLAELGLYRASLSQLGSDRQCLSRRRFEAGVK